jgi:hypothetical protein
MLSTLSFSAGYDYGILEVREVTSRVCAASQIQLTKANLRHYQTGINTLAKT